MNILGKIIETKIGEVDQCKRSVPLSALANDRMFDRKTISLKESLQRNGSTGIIAEFKRKSPSMGIINSEADIELTCANYVSAGASAVSILTDHHFGGSLQELRRIRDIIRIPILRKDFIIDEYQVMESKAAGADAILLIASVLSPSKMQRLHDYALSIGLEVIVEIHSKKCISKIPEKASITGVNSRDLKSFRTDPGSFERLIKDLPGSLKVAESGISEPEHYVALKKAGFGAFLIGTAFMKYQQPGEACLSFIESVKKLTAK